MNRWNCLILLTTWVLSLSGEVFSQGNDRRWQLRTAVHAAAEPTGEFLKTLCQKHKVEVAFDPSVESEGVTVTPFTLDAEGVSLGAVVDLVCQNAELSYVVDKGTLKITTHGADDTHPYPVLYPLAQLGPMAEPLVFVEEVKLMIAGDWGVGGHEMAIGPQGLAVTTSRKMHLKTEQFLDVLSSAVAGRPRPPTPQEKANQLLFRKLQTVKPFAGEATTVKEALDQLLAKNGIPLWIDALALGDAAIDLSQLSTTVDPKKMATTARLDALLPGHKLTWRVRSEVVQITTQERVDQENYVVAYDIRRAITPVRTPSGIVDELLANPEIDFENGYAMAFQAILLVDQNGPNHAKLAALLR